MYNTMVQWCHGLSHNQLYAIGGQELGISIVDPVRAHDIADNTGEENGNKMQWQDGERRERESHTLTSAQVENTDIDEVMNLINQAHTDPQE